MIEKSNMLGWYALGWFYKVNVQEECFTLVFEYNLDSPSLEWGATKDCIQVLVVLKEDHLALS